MTDQANIRLLQGAIAGNLAECEEARKEGATYFNGMLYGAAHVGHRDLCELAVSWGATDFDRMLYQAAYGGHRDLCELAVSWVKAHGYPLDVRDFNQMLYNAAQGGHRDICELAVSWAKAHGDPFGATDFDRMLSGIARDRVDLQILAKYWRACASNPTLPAWVSLFTLLLVTDGYFVLSAKASAGHVRWFRIVSQLPLELQATVCFRCHGLVQEPVITRQRIDEGGQWLWP